MKVSILAPDSRIPNLACMKLSAWHKKRGDEVHINLPLIEDRCDVRYASYVFTNSVKDHHPDTIVGGTGIDMHAKLPDEVERAMPDYDGWRCGYAMGFASRGCPHRCPFCFVPEKEGPIRAHAHPDEFVQPHHAHVMFLDNNILAAPNCDEILMWCERFAGSVDFNQGLDCRLIDGPMAKALARVKIRPYIRLAVDTDASKGPFEKAYRFLRGAGVPLGRSCVMVLVGQSGRLAQDDIDRVMWVASIGRLDPFAMPYMPKDAGVGWKPSRTLRDFARWVNRKHLFRSCTWQEYQDGLARTPAGVAS